MTIRDDDDDDKSLDADDKRVKTARDRVAARAGKAAKADDDDDSSIDADPAPDPNVIEVSDDDDDGEDEPRPSRKERRSNRYREAQELARQNQERADRLEAQLTQITQQLIQRPAAGPAQPQQPQAHPLDKEIDEVYSQRKLLSQAFHAKQGKMTPAEFEDFERQSRALESKQFQLEARKAIPAPAQQPQMDPTTAHLRMVHHDVLSNPRAASYAQGEFLRRKAQNPNTPEVELINEACQEARKAFRMPVPGGGSNRAASPPASVAQRYAAPPKGGGGGNGGSGGGVKTVKMDESRRRMANAMFSHIPDEKKRMQLWARKVGVKLDS